MSEKKTPRVFIVRHGETEWSRNGRHTSTTDLPLTADGEKRVLATGKALVGEDRLIVPETLAHVYVSPRQRARRTLSLLGIGFDAASDPHAESTLPTCSAKLTVTPLLAEWDYGFYEGLTSSEIRSQRTEQGIDKPGQRWDIWRDGCVGGDSPAEVMGRCDDLIAEIREKWHRPALNERGGSGGDVLLVAHGHLLRAFAMRWVGKRLDEGLTMLLEAGGVGTLSYEHHSVKEPAILLGGAFTVGNI